LSLDAALYIDLIGKPFCDDARGPDAYDCWGLLQTVLRRMGHAPTDFPSNPALLLQAIADEWQPLDREPVQPGDGILLRSTNPRYQWHVGVVVAPSRYLHAQENIGVVIERYDLPVTRRRVQGFYRYRGLPI
jgi:cell wall-associated NlpC family hydrolase